MMNWMKRLGITEKFLKIFSYSPSKTNPRLIAGGIVSQHVVLLHLQQLFVAGADAVAEVVKQCRAESHHRTGGEGADCDNAVGGAGAGLYLYGIHSELNAVHAVSVKAF